MNIFRYIKNKITLRRLHQLRPQIIYGYKKSNGELLKDTRISSSTVLNGEANLNIANNVFIGHFNFIEASNGITIKEGCQITNYISILSHSSHISIRLYGTHFRTSKNHKGYIKGDVYIGGYTFIGPHSTIMPNTKIGKGCLVSGYSMVSGNFPDFSIIKGNPAKVVGSTKDLDKEYLEDPEILKMYNQWAEND